MKPPAVQILSTFVLDPWLRQDWRSQQAKKASEAKRPEEARPSRSPERCDRS